MKSVQTPSAIALLTYKNITVKLSPEDQRLLLDGVACMSLIEPQAEHLHKTLQFLFKSGGLCRLPAQPSDDFGQGVIQ